MITNVLVNAVNDTWSGNIKISGTEVAGKTGTTNIDAATLKAKNLPADLIPDSWNITYNPEYAIALWYGYDEHQFLLARCYQWYRFGHCCCIRYHQE